MKKIFLFDGMAIIYRSYFAVINNQLITKDGSHTSAIFGFLKAKNQKSWYLIFGLATAGGILSKSVLGIFPLAIIFFYLIFSCQWK